MSSQIFICYRREDSAVVCGRIYDHLVERFRRQAVFKDVDDMPAGVNFHSYIDSILDQCNVLLAIIGPHWLDTQGASSTSQIGQPSENVRLELEAAFHKRLTIIPLLVQGAKMPAAEQLPESIRELAFLNALHIRDDPDFREDMRRVGDAVAIVERRMPDTNILVKQQSAPQRLTSDQVPPSMSVSTRGKRAKRWVDAISILASLATIIGVGVVLWPVISHTDLSLFPAPTHTASPTYNASPNYTPLSQAALYMRDSLTDNGQNHGWDTQTNAGGSCGFGDGGYKLTAPANGGIECLSYGAPAPPADFAIQVTMTILQGLSTADSGAAVVFRATPPSVAGYYFGFNTQGDGTLGVVSSHGSETILPALTFTTTEFHKGYGQKNILVIQMTGTTLQIYVNSYLFGSTTDVTYQRGRLGFDVGAGKADNAAVVFSNLTVWQL